jgi:nickel-type superoxide dismutase maturation protease
MTPTLLPGDRLLVAAGPARWARRPAVGSVVAVRDPRRPDRILVKRVAAVDGAAGTCTVAGDNPPASTDSRQFGPVPLAGVVGRVVYRYGPPGRTGPLDRAGEYHRG